MPAPVMDTYQLKIYNSSGKVVYSKMISTLSGEGEQSISIDIPDLKPGMYIIHIFSGEIYARESIIVQ
jgi:hypothetical protein